MTGAGDIVITGVGTLGAHGVGVEVLAAALASGRPRPTEVDRSDGVHRTGGARTAALIADVPVQEFVAPGVARRMSRPSRLAVCSLPCSRKRPASTTAAEATICRQRPLQRQHEML